MTWTRLFILLGEGALTSAELGMRGGCCACSQQGCKHMQPLLRAAALLMHHVLSCAST